MSNPTRIGQEAPDLKTPSSPSRITPTRALDDDAEHQMSKSEPPAPKYPYVLDNDGVARVGYVAVDPAQHNKATELQLWPLFGSKLTFARPHMRAFHFQWLSFFVAFMAWFAYAPLLVIIRQDLDISTRGIWLSNVCNVAACVVARFVVGPLGDKYGAVRIHLCGNQTFAVDADSPVTFHTGVQAGLLTFVGVCTLFSGLPKNLAELCVLRFFIGVAGATFVITQLWTSEMFAKNVVGLANALTAGWGNCGGGFTILIMGYVYEGLRSAGLSRNQAWRNAFYIPGAIVLIVAAALYAYSDECPQGTLRDAIRAGTRQRQTMRKSARDGLKNINSWILFAQYAACFGVELHVNNAMAMYFYDEYGLSIGTAGLVASLFGWMNLFARGLGGYCSDLANTNGGMRGRLAVHGVSLLAEGLVLVCFSYVSGLGMAIFTLVVFSILTQAAEGTTFAIVPFVAPKALGSVAGVVGAGGNVGAVAWGLMFMFGSSGPQVGIIIILSAFLTLGINIKGAGSLFRNDMDSTIERRARGDDDDDSFHTASALTPSSIIMASLP